MTESIIEMTAAKIRALDPKTKNIVLRFLDLLILAQESPEAETAVNTALLYAAEQTNQVNTKREWGS